MHLVPTQEDVVELLRSSGALRDGHFEYPNGLHANEYVQMALATRHYDDARALSVGLGRRLRTNPELRAILPELSVVAPATGGLPVAYGVCEALQARQVYFAEREEKNEPLRFRTFLNVAPGEKVLLVDDILRTGRKLTHLRKLIEEAGGEVVALAVMVYQPTPNAQDFGSLPLYYLCKLDATYAQDAAACELCRGGVPLTKISEV